MSLVSLIVALVIFGVAFWLISTYVPPPAKNWLSIALGIIVILWLLAVFGLIGDISAIRVG